MCKNYVDLKGPDSHGVMDTTAAACGSREPVISIQ